MISSHKITASWQVAGNFCCKLPDTSAPLSMLIDADLCNLTLLASERVKFVCSPPLLIYHHIKFQTIGIYFTNGMNSTLKGVSCLISTGHVHHYYYYYCTLPNCQHQKRQSSAQLQTSTQQI